MTRRPLDAASQKRLEQALASAVDRYGAAMLRDLGRLRGELSTAAPDDRDAIDALFAAVAERVPQSLLDAQSDAELASTLPRLVDRLARGGSLGRAEATWSVRAWAHALALSTAGLDASGRAAPVAVSTAAASRDSVAAVLGGGSPSSSRRPSATPGSTAPDAQAEFAFDAGTFASSAAIVPVDEADATRTNASSQSAFDDRMPATRVERRSEAHARTEPTWQWPDDAAVPRAPGVDASSAEVLAGPVLPAAIDGTMGDGAADGPRDAREAGASSLAFASTAAVPMSASASHGVPGERIVDAPDAGATDRAVAAHPPVDTTADAADFVPAAIVEPAPPVDPLSPVDPMPTLAASSGAASQAPATATSGERARGRARPRMWWAIAAGIAAVVAVYGALQWASGPPSSPGVTTTTVPSPSPLPAQGRPVASAGTSPAAEPAAKTTSPVAAPAVEPATPAMPPTPATARATTSDAAPPSAGPVVAPRPAHIAAATPSRTKASRVATNAAPKPARAASRRTVAPTGTPHRSRAAVACDRATCGSVVATHEQGDGATRRYEMTIRMDDRSIRTLRQATPLAPGTRMGSSAGRLVPLRP